jgi:hypothetical protein
MKKSTILCLSPKHLLDFFNNMICVSQAVKASPEYFFTIRTYECGGLPCFVRSIFSIHTFNVHIYYIFIAMWAHGTHMLSPIIGRKKFSTGLLAVSAKTFAGDTVSVAIQTR